jgi:hypothetical protein
MRGHSLVEFLCWVEGFLKWWRSLGGQGVYSDQLASRLKYLLIGRNNYVYGWQRLVSFLWLWLIVSPIMCVYSYSHHQLQSTGLVVSSAYKKRWVCGGRGMSERSRGNRVVARTAQWCRQANLFFLPCTVFYHYSKTNVMHCLFSLLRINGLYMFRALLAQIQEALHKRRWGYWICFMSLGCTNSGTAIWHSTHVIYQVPFV